MSDKLFKIDVEADEAPGAFRLSLSRVDEAPQSITEDDSLWIDVGPIKNYSKSMPPAAMVYSFASTETGADEAQARLWKRVGNRSTELEFRPPKGEAFSAAVLVVSFTGLSASVSTEISLAVELTLAEETHRLQAVLKLQTPAPQIHLFSVQPSSILVMGADYSLDWECEGAQGIEIRSDGKSIHRTDQTTGSFKGLADKDQRLELVAHSPGHKVSREVEMWAKSKEWHKASSSPWGSGPIYGLTTDRQAQLLYALVGAENSANLQLWCSSNGLSDWALVTTLAVDHSIAELADSPFIWFSNQLYLVAGSKLDVTRSSDALWSLDPVSGVWSCHQETPRPSPRAGHSCVVCTDETGDEKLWVLGGCDTYGNALNEVWTWDGMAWEEKHVPEWDPRLLSGAATDGKSLWIGAGFREPTGTSLNDVWQWQQQAGLGHWQQLTQASKTLLKMFGEAERLRGAALAYHAGDLFEVGTVEHEAKIMSFFARLDHEALNGHYVRSPLSANGRENWSVGDQESVFQLVSFNGCLWLVSEAFGYDAETGQSGVKRSQLFYYPMNGAGM
ncbi:MAG: kelch repeat-containing protein [Gammaproteobacteria bacterium]